MDNFPRLASIWRIETPPEWMKKQSTVNKMSWRDIMDFRREHREECRLNGMGESMFAADAVLPTTRYKEAKENRVDRIHPASLLRLPVCYPAD